MLGTVVVGVIFTDIKGFPSGQTPMPGRTLGKVEYVHGGVSRNVAENIAVSGMPVTFVSMTEPGGIGREVVERLNLCGVNTEFILPASENGIGKWMVVFDEKGDIAGQISCPPDMKPLTDFVDAYGNAFVQDADQVILELDLGRETVDQVISLAERYGKKVYAIAGNMSVLLEHRELIGRTDCLICNEAQFAGLSETDSEGMPLEELSEVLKREVETRNFPSTVVTLGERGCVYFDRSSGRVGALPAADTEVMDTSGAGDAFLAGVVMGLSENLPLSVAAELGTQLAGLTVQTTGRCCPVNTIPADFLRKMS